MNACTRNTLLNVEMRNDRHYRHHRLDRGASLLNGGLTHTT